MHIFDRGDAGKGILCFGQAPALAQFLLQAHAQIEQVVGVQARIGQLGTRQGTLSPVGALHALVHDHVELFFQDSAQSHFGPAEDAGGP